MQFGSAYLISIACGRTLVSHLLYLISARVSELLHHLCPSHDCYFPPLRRLLCYAMVAVLTTSGDHHRKSLLRIHDNTPQSSCRG